jgi:hypothetical protein
LNFLLLWQFWNQSNRRQLPTIKGSDTESKDSIQERISSVNKKGKFSPEVVQKTMLLELALLLLM